MNRIITLFLFNLLIVFSMQGVEPMVVTGFVSDHDGAPIEGVVVTRIELPDSTYRGLTLTDSNGKYILESDSVCQRSLMMFTMAGYEKLYREVGDSAVVNVRLDQKITELAELTVSSRKSSMISAPGTYVYFPESLYKSTRNASDLIKNVPMINPGEGGINIFSKVGDADILVNWRPLDMPYKVFIESLKKLPPNAVKAVIIMFSPSAIVNAEAYNRGQICFLVDEIVVGTLYGATNYTGIRSGEEFTSNSIWMAWQNRKWRITGSVNYNQNADNLRTDIEYLYNNRGLKTLKSSRDKVDAHSLSGNISGRYTLGKNDADMIALTLSMSGDKRWNRSVATTDSETERGATSHAESDNVITRPFGKPSFGLSAAYYKTFVGKDAWLNFYGGLMTSPENLESSNMKYSGQLIDGDILGTDYSQLYGSKSNGQSLSVKFVKSFRGPGLSLEAGYDIGYGRTDFRLKYNDVDQQKFGYSELANNAAVSLTWRIKSFSLRGGVRMEQFHRICREFIENTTTSADFVNFCPDVALSYNLKGGLHIFGLDYRGGTTKPIYSMLNPMKVWLSETMYSQGDPYLKPILYHDISFRYTYRSCLTASIGYHHAPKCFNELIVPSELGDNITVMKYAQFGRNQRLYAILKFDKTFFNDLIRFNGSTTYRYTRTRTGESGSSADFTASNFNIEGFLSWKISKKKGWHTGAGLYFFTPSKRVGLTATTKSGLNVGLSKSFDFGLEVSFRYHQSLKKRTLTYYSDDYSYSTTDPDMLKPQFKINIEYVFGNHKVEKLNHMSGTTMDNMLR